MERGVPSVHRGHAPKKGGGGIALLGKGGGAGGSLCSREGFGHQPVAGCHCEDVASVVWPRIAVRAASRKRTRRRASAAPAVLRARGVV
jgi:hypothetical protein